ncbi:G2/M phase-specific E3 ubiquitin-protein ligase isoform X2 [Pangasianodon hypophthalmus]|uniref:G2/M phase-specific E3 ubiquitin-protein ligase isoform X2 n=1 Tax=Pangasianodon hypophthalmus TaxID=310915 RepID=UPI002306DFAC|nr:G2/M phase-specific E3 ubiquitin-protein ligase isoform X2 [Pangasianodon hypophthalmus]
MTLLFNYLKVEYSPRGSSRRALEEVAVGQCRDFLIVVEDGDAAVQEDGGDLIEVTLEDVLVFASGASAIPAFGFRETIRFLHYDLNGIRWMFPEANTSVITLKLPIGHDYDGFCHLITSGIIQSPMFGVAQ